MRPGQAERRTHDYERHGVTTLFAALDVKAGTIVGKCMPRHRAREFRKFLDEVERNVPANLDIHVVMDNASSHKTKLIRAWFAKRRRWNVHFTPTSSSWINQVERFFALLSEQQIKRGVHRSTAELEAAIEKKGYNSDAGMRLERFTFGCRAALDGPVSQLDRHHGNFETLTLRELTPFCREHCGGGLLYQFHTPVLEPLAAFIDRRDQTMSYFGFEGDSLRDLAQMVSTCGIDRIVPIGRALDFDRYWDGYDLFLEFSRHVTVANYAASDPQRGRSDSGAA